MNRECLFPTFQARCGAGDGEEPLIGVKDDNPFTQSCTFSVRERSLLHSDGVLLYCL